MGKQGPCCHCGVTSTPLWRNGPPNKPVLCNACGSRWRTKGTLVNYAPLHVRGYASIELQSRNSYERVRPLNNTKLELVHVTKTKPDVSQVTDQIKDNLEAVPAIHKKDACSKCSEEDTGNRSTSASGKSYSESSVQFDDTDGNETTGSVQSHAWDSQIPSRKRTCLKRQGPSSVEKLQKELYDILHDQELSSLSELSEDVLLFETEAPIDSVEIGLGSILIRAPDSSGWGEESEGSSFPSENIHHIKNKPNTGLSIPLLQSESCEISSTMASNDRPKQAIEMRKQSKENYPKRLALANKSFVC